MIRINVKEITLNVKKTFQIANAANSERLKSYLTVEANNVLKEAWPKIPYNVRGKTPHMRDKYEVTKPSKTSFKIEGQKFPSCQVRIKPKGKYQVYYAVVTAGKKNGQALNYSSSTAEPYAIENTVKKRQNLINQGAIQELLKEVENVENQ